ncbi:MAG: 50S ribosomal protein L18 [SAR202 cluster bacterium]|nr:50S ribosomal protein L18 [SAR202 cluster bacterium]
MGSVKTASHRRIIRHERVRRKIVGTAERPRLAVFRSLNHIYAQVIDDTKRATLASASSLDPKLRGDAAKARKSDVSKLVGALVAQRAKEKGVKTVVFDRGGTQFHGRVKALADAARKGGLEF